MTSSSWRIPAKTFLLGEYAALAGHSAIIITTAPYFEIRLSTTPGLHGIHPDSPAGRWWAQCPSSSQQGLHWFDPYQGAGGMGASSAQFIGVYQAHAALTEQDVDPKALLKAYRDLTQSPVGLAPSAYDVQAQRMTAYLEDAVHCVYLNHNTQCQYAYRWPFKEIGFILIHTQHKIATHEHLQSLHTLQNVAELGAIVDQAKVAFDQQDSESFVKAVQTYHHALNARSWVAPQTLKLIDCLQTEYNPLAIKGCGALGADVILLLVEQTQVQRQLECLSADQWRVLATSLG